jgi:hypothetical protein
MLPVVFPDEFQKDVVYSLPYSDETLGEDEGAGARKKDLPQLPPRRPHLPLAALRRGDAR